MTPAPTGTDLNALMEFGHVVHSDGINNVAYVGGGMPDTRHLWAPQPFVDLDAEGQMIDLSPAGIYDLGDWTLLNGFSGQDRYSGPIMHPSEYVGGGLERHIRENAGYYVVVEIAGFGPEGAEDNGEPVGWAVAYQAEPE